MQHSTRSMSMGRFAPAIAATAAMASLFVFAVPANAESKDAVAATLDSAEASLPSAEPTAPPIPGAESIDAPAEVNAPVPEATEAGGGGNITHSAAESAAGAVSSPTLPDPHSTSDLPSTPNLSSTRAPTEAAAAELGARAPDLGANVPSTDRLSELAGRIHEDTSKTTAPITRSAKTAVQAVVDRTEPIEHVHALIQHPLQTVGEALQGRLSDPLVPKTVESLLPGAGADPGALPHRTTSRPPSALPTGAYLRNRGANVDSSQIRHPIEIGGVELWRFEAAGAATDPSRAPADAVGNSPGRTGERLENLAPLDRDGPTPSPSSPLTVASGLGGSSFVPIVALLALLALAAPAILRRLRGVPDLPAPTRFVCALERPG